MKHLTWKLVLPLTVISFVMVTKWWYVQIDEFRVVLTGFPLPYVCPGWHTSMSFQIFVVELLADIVAHFLFWFFVVLIVNGRVRSIVVPRYAAITLFVIAGFFFMSMILLGSLSDNIYTVTREFDIRIIETGYRFFWQDDSPAKFGGRP